jgi:hypothetical protein
VVQLSPQIENGIYWLLVDQEDEALVGWKRRSVRLVGVFGWNRQVCEATKKEGIRGMYFNRQQAVELLDHQHDIR